MKVWTRQETLPAIGNFPPYFFRMARNRFPDGQKKKNDYLTAIRNTLQPVTEFRSPVQERITSAEYSEGGKGSY